MGDFATSEATSNQTQKANSTTKTDPWGPQAGYLKDIFAKAQSTYNNTSQDPYTGDHLAAFRPEQLSMFNNMIDYANTSPVGNLLFGQGANLSGLGQGALGAGFQGLQDFRPNDTMGTIADASLYADNPFINGMVDAATRDSERATYEDGIPSIQRQAALSGNTNSSRTGAKEAILERAHQDRRADVSAGLRGDAFQRGIGHAQAGRDAEMSRLMSLTGTGLQTALGGDESLRNSVASMRELFGLGNEGGAGLQASDQQALSNELAKYSFLQDSAWAPLMNYFSIIGANNWGGTSKTKGVTNTTGTATQTASPAATIGGLLTSVGSLIPGK